LSAERARACTQTRATWWASTGPRSFERGEHHARAFAIPHGPASTGPRSFERGEIRTAFGDKAASALQRGRAHLSAESGPSAQCPHAPADASTGPRSFERGEIQKRGGRATYWLLQRGRAHLSAERSGPRGMPHRRRHRFNGAALI